MLKVRKKSLLDSADNAILRMSDTGIPLSWDRYEEQLPFCGFTQNGLNCSACLQGPCRINPFGDKPDHGICGADGRRIIMHNLFEKVKKGTLEHLNVLLDIVNENGASDKAVDNNFTSSLVSQLPEAAVRSLEGKKLIPQNILIEVVTARDPFFVDPEMLDSSMQNILRLGICSILSSMAVCQHGGDAASPEDLEPSSPHVSANILLDGTLPKEFFQSLDKALKGRKDVRLVGTAGSGCLHMRGVRLVSPGSPELAAASGSVDFVIQSDLDGYPSIKGVCDQMGIPRLTISNSGPRPNIDEIIEKAINHQKQKIKLDKEDFSVLSDRFSSDIGEVISDAVQKNTAKGVVLLIGGTNVRQTNFERTAKIMKGLLSNDVIVLTAGEAAAGALHVEGIIEAAGQGIKKVMQGRPYPWFYLGSIYETARALDAMGPFAGRKGFTGAPLASTFVEIPSYAYLSSAFGWLAMGIPTQIGTPLPIWGNRDLTKHLIGDAETGWGDLLLASPKLASPEEQVRQILDKLGSRG